MRGNTSLNGGLSSFFDTRSTSTNLSGFLRQKNRALAEQPWQIIKVIKELYSLVVHSLYSCGTNHVSLFVCYS